jgi:MFS family permease
MIYHNINLKPWLVVLTASLFLFYVYIQSNILDALSPFIFQEFHLSAAQLGNLSAAFFYSSIFCIFPAGILLDIFSVKKIIIFSLVGMILSTYLFAISHSLPILFLSRILSGIFCSPCLLDCMKLTSRWFEPKKHGLVAGIILAVGMLGGILAEAPMAAFALKHGFRNTMLFNVFLGILSLILIIIQVKDYPRKDHEKEKSITRIWATLLVVIKKPINWFGAIYTSLLNLPVFLLAGLWGAIYLVQTRNFSLTEGSFAVSMIFLGVAIGSPIMGYFAGKTDRHKMLMILGAIFSIAILLFLSYGPYLNLFFTALTFLLFGFFSGTQIISYPLIIAANQLSQVGTAFGFVSTLVMAGGLLQPVLGLLLDWRWNQQMQNGIPFYQNSDYQRALLVIIIAFIASVLCVLLIPKKQ